MQLSAVLYGIEAKYHLDITEQKTSICSQYSFRLTILTKLDLFTEKFNIELTISPILYYLIHLAIFLMKPQCSLG